MIVRGLNRVLGREGTPSESETRLFVEGGVWDRRQYAHERAYVDEHATFIGAEVRQETSNDVDGAAYIERELPINRTFFGELQRSVGASAGIVDHYVDLPESSDGLLRRYLHLLDIRYIQLENLDVVICGQLAFLFRRPHGSRDVPASLCAMERRQFTQAATGAGNEYRLGHDTPFYGGDFRESQRACHAALEAE